MTFDEPSRRCRSEPWRSPHPVREKGFTHVEVLVAILIIGLATPMLMSGIMSTLTQTRRSYDRSAATVWVQGEVEFLRRQCYERLQPSARKVTSASLRAGEPPLPEGFTAAYVQTDRAGAGLLRATVGLYARDWTSIRPPEAPIVQTTTYIGDLRTAGVCP
jgi:type II secretory pathway component PulJ